MMPAWHAVGKMRDAHRRMRSKHANGSLPLPLTNRTTVSQQLSIAMNTGIFQRPLDPGGLEFAANAGSTIEFVRLLPRSMLKIRFF